MVRYYAWEDCTYELEPAARFPLVGQGGVDPPTPEETDLQPAAVADLLLTQIKKIKIILLSWSYYTTWYSRYGGTEGVRTLNFLRARQAVSQLAYGPINNPYHNSILSQ